MVRQVKYKIFSFLIFNSVVPRTNESITKLNSIGFKVQHFQLYWNETCISFKILHPYREVLIKIQHGVDNSYDGIESNALARSNHATITSFL